MAIALDNIGREINTVNMTLGEIKGLVGSLMKEKVGTARPVEKTDSNPVGNNQEHLGKIHDLLETFTKDYNTEVKEQKGFLQTIIDTLKDFGVKREEKKAEPKDKNAKQKPSKEERAIANSSDKLAKEFHKTLGTKGSGWVHDPYCEKILGQIFALMSHNTPMVIAEAIKKATKTGDDKIALSKDGKNDGHVGHGGHGGHGGSKGHSHEDDYEVIGEKNARRLTFTRYLLNEIEKISSNIQDNFLGFNAFNNVVDGWSDKERKFTQEIRATAYEIAGVTKESKNLQTFYEKIGASTNETGMSRTQTQKFYIKALRAGVKDSKIGLNIIKSQLHIEEQIGVEAGTLNDTFISMHHAGRMNNMQIAQMGHGMKDVARNTGITGDALVDAIKGSEEFTNNLRKASQLTASSVENIIEISALAKQMGIANEMQPLLAAMSSTNNLMFKASKGTQALLFQAAGSMGRTQELMNGTILKSKSGIKDMATGFDNVLKQFGVDSLDAVDNLSDGAKSQLNMQLNAAFGIELGDMRSVIETMQEAGKGMADRLADITKQRKLNLSVEEKSALDEKERSLKASKSMSILTALSEATKGTGEGVEGMTQALSKFNKRKSEFEGDMTAMGQSWTSSGEAARQSIEAALKEINVGRKKEGMEAVKIDSSDIEAALKDKDALKLVTDRLTKGQQELAVKQKKSLDPMTDMAFYLDKINDNVRDFTQSLFSKMFNSILGRLIAITGVLASILAGVSFLGFNSFNYYDSFKKLEENFRKYMGWEMKKGVKTVVEKASTTITAPPEKEGWFKSLFKSKETKPIGTPGSKIHGPPRPGEFIGPPRPGVDRAAQSATKARILEARRLRLSGVANNPVVPPQSGSAFTKGFGRARAAGDGFFKSLTRGFTGSSRSLGESFGNSIIKTTDKLGKKIAKETAELAKNPLNSYVRLVKESWKGVWEATKFGVGRTVSTAWNIFDRGVSIIGGAGKNAIMSLGNVSKVNWKSIKDVVVNGWGGIRTAMSAGTKGIVGIGEALGGVVRMGGVAAGSTVKFISKMNPFGLAIMAGMAAVEGLTGGLEAGSRAGVIFGKEQKKVTLNQEYAAKSAGMLVGVLNSLAFGIPGLIFPLENFTNSLAIFISKVPILNGILSVFMVLLEAAWGIIKGVGLLVWEVAKGIWDAIVSIIKPIFDGFTAISEAIGKVFGSGVEGDAGAMTTAFRELGGVIGIVSGAISSIGTAIGWIFRTVGKAIGFVITGIMKFVEGFMVVFEPIAEVFSEVGKAFGEVGKGFSDIFDQISPVFAEIGGVLYETFKPIIELFSSGSGSYGFLDALKQVGFYFGKFAGILVKVVLAPLMLLAKVIAFVGKVIQAFSSGNIIGGITDAFKSLGVGIYSVLSSIVTDSIKWFWTLWDVLVGHSIIPDLVNGIIDWFSKLPGRIFSFLLNIPKMIGAVFSNVGSYFEKLGNSTGFFGGMISQVGNIIGFIGKVIGNLSTIVEGYADLLFGIFTFDGDKIFKGLGKIWSGLSGIVTDGFNFLYKSIVNNLSGLLNLGWLVVAISKGLSTVYSFVGSYFDSLGNTTGILGPMFAQIGNIIGFIGKVIGHLSTALGGVIDIITGIFTLDGSKILDGLGKIWDGLSGIVTDVFSFLYKSIVNNLTNLLNLGWLAVAISNGFSIVLSVIGSYFDSFGETTGILGPIFAQLGNIFGFVGKVIGHLSTALGGVIDIITGIFTLDGSKILDGLGKIWSGLSGIVSDGFKFIKKSFVNSAKMLWKLVKTSLWTMFIGIPALIVSALSGLMNLGSWLGGWVLTGLMYLGKKVINFFYELPGKMWAGFKSIGSMLFDGVKTAFTTVGGFIKDSICKVGDYLYTSFTEALGSAWIWFEDFYKNPHKKVEKAITSVTGQLTSDEQHKKNEAVAASRNVTMEESAKNNAKKVADDPNKDLESKIKELITKEKNYRDLAEVQKREAASIQSQYDKESNTWSSTLGLNSGYLKELQMSQTQSLDNQSGYQRQASATLQQRRDLEATKPQVTMPNETDKVTADAAKTLTEHAVEKNSIYTHDTHCEKLLFSIDTNMQILTNLFGGNPTKIQNPIPEFDMTKIYSKFVPNEQNNAKSTTEVAQDRLTSKMENQRFNANQLNDLPNPREKDIFGQVKEWSPHARGDFGKSEHLIGIQGTYNNDKGKQYDRFGNPAGGTYNSTGTNWMAKDADKYLPQVTIPNKTDKVTVEKNSITQILTNLFGGNPTKMQNPIPEFDMTKMAIKLISSQDIIQVGLDQIYSKLAPNEQTNWEEKRLIPEPTKAASVLLPSLPDIGREMAQRTAETQTQKTEVISPELGELTEEASEQTLLLERMVALFEQFVDLAKPKSSINQSGGGMPGDTATRKASHSPPNFYRAPIGHVAQTAAKAILNVGSKNI